jgi:NAD(P)-dependent dehydrogenase (short-subunit alcohol dehydrogenase family)
MTDFGHDFAGEVVLVTGGNRGIGRVIAERFADAGAAVAITGRDEDALGLCEQVLKARGATVLAVRSDVGSEPDVRRAVSAVESQLGPVTALVNNAAISGPTAAVQDMARADFEAVLTTNLVGPFLTAKHVLPGMCSRGSGSVVNIGSIAGVQAYPLRSPYSASKWGLEGLTRTLAAEVGPDGVRVNLVAPGPTEGERSTDVIAARAQAQGIPFEELRARYEAQIPLQRFVTGAEVAAAVLFLSSPAASGITGQSFCVSGGIEI